MTSGNSASLLYNEAKKAWEKIGKSRSEKDLKMEVELYKKMLDIFQVGDYFCMIFNPAVTAFEYCSAAVQSVLGYTNLEFTPQLFFSLLHPEDAIHYVQFESKITEFFMALPVEKVMKYKTRYDFRVQHKSGHYVRILQQVVTINMAVDGAVIHTFVVFTDITHLKTSTQMSLSLIGLEGEPSYIDAHKQLNEIVRPQPLSKREKQVLALLAQNKTSEEIAGQLHISRHTVDNHRKRMLNKTETSSTLQLVIRAIEEGWL